MARLWPSKAHPSPSVATQNEASSESWRSLKHRQRRGCSKTVAASSCEQTGYNRQIEELFKLNQHEKAWQVFAEMIQAGAKPNVATYTLLFKNVRKDERDNGRDIHYVENDVDRVIQLFFQLNASQKQLRQPLQDLRVD